MGTLSERGRKYSVTKTFHAAVHGRAIRLACVLLAVLTVGAVAAAAGPGESAVEARAVLDRKPLDVGDKATLAVAVTVDAGWHIQSAKPYDKYLKATRVEVTTPAGVTGGEPRYPVAKDIPSNGMSAEPFLAIYEETI